MTEKMKSRSRKQSLDRFEAGGGLRPVHALNEREARIDSLPAAEKELAKESARFADLCQFFEQKQIDVPSEIIERLTRVSTLPPAERVAVMKNLNHLLMEHLQNVDSGTGIRQ